MAQNLKKVAVAGAVQHTPAAPTQHRVAVAGATGRMGHMLIEAIRGSSDCLLTGALDLASSPAIGNDAAAFLGHASGVPVTADVRAGLERSQVLIDFTRPEGTMAHLAACRAAGVNAVIGTTGFSDDQKARITEIARDIAIMMAPNMSVGVNVTMKLIEMAAKALSTGYDIEIIEAHHRHKVDAPSGTALKLGEVVASVFKQELSSASVHGRRGETGVRPGKQIGFHAIRGGDIVGEHTVIFAGTGERVEVTVRSQSRMTYALGALRAAKWLHGRPPGLYDMSDVLGLR